MNTNPNLLNSEQICVRLSISRRTFQRLIPILKQFGLFQTAVTGRGAVMRWFIRENNLEKYINGLESGQLRPLIKQFLKQKETSTTVEGSAVLPR